MADLFASDVVFHGMWRDFAAVFQRSLLLKRLPIFHFEAKHAADLKLVLLLNGKIRRSICC